MMHFTKMHGLGNDFVVVNTLNQSVDINTLPMRQLANSHVGIGFDQLLLLSAATNADFTCRFFNADGSEAEQCGNGIRCIARYIHEERLSPNHFLRIATRAGIIDVTIHSYDRIAVNMGTPITTTMHLLEHAITTVSLGNPHAILIINDIENAPVESLGKALATHTYFQQGANVGFMEIVNRQRIRLRTYERGVGETLACGSNACAAVIAGIAEQKLDSNVTVELLLGELHIERQNPTAPVLMTGPAARVFSGILY